jgi:hypothetical protein
MRHGAVDVVRVDQPALQRLAEVGKGLTALQVAAALDGKRGALGRVGGDAMRGVQVVERPAVGDDVPAEAPLPP